VFKNVGSQKECALKQQKADLFKYIFIFACAYLNPIYDAVKWGSVPHKAWRTRTASVDGCCYWNE